MFTFEFTSFWLEQQEPKQDCIDVVTMYLGEPNKLVVMKEDAEDLASSFSVLMHYDGLRLNEVPVWMSCENLPQPMRSMLWRTTITPIFGSEDRDLLYTKVLIAENIISDF
jgi:hypothetical protein